MEIVKPLDISFLQSATEALDDLGVDDTVTDTLAFIFIGLSAWIGAGQAVTWWTGGVSFATWWGAANFAGAVAYTVGSLAECVLWTFALLESELSGFNTEVTPFFNWWAPIVEYFVGSHVEQLLFGRVICWLLVMRLMGCIFDENDAEIIKHKCRHNP